MLIITTNPQTHRAFPSDSCQINVVCKNCFVFFFFFICSSVFSAHVYVFKQCALCSESYLCRSLFRCPSLKDRGGEGVCVCGGGCFSLPLADKHTEAQAGLLRPHCFPPHRAEHAAVRPAEGQRERNLPGERDVEETQWPETTDQWAAWVRRVKEVNYVWSSLQTAKIYPCLASYSGEHEVCNERTVDLLSQTYGRRNWSNAADFFFPSESHRALTAFHRSIFAGCIGFSKYCGPHTQLSPAESGKRVLNQLVWNLLCPSNDTTQSQAGGNKGSPPSLSHSPSPLIYSLRCYEWFCLFSSLILNIAHY